MLMMKTLLVAWAALLCLPLTTGLGAVRAQPYYTKPCTDKQLAKEARAWVKSQTWRNGYQGAAPHKSVNLVEFYTQYRRNQKQWDAMFRWLASNDLLTIEKGKYPIEGTTLVASVEDSSNQPLDKRKSESHYNHIDFQVVVKGTERFAILDHTTSTPDCPYKPDVIRYNYDVERTLFYDSTPERFFIFFPCDWHIAKVATDKQDQTIRVIVVKLDYIE